LLGELVWVEGTAGEIVAFDFDCRHLAAAVVDSNYQIFRLGMLVDVDLSKGNPALAKELLGAAAVAAKARTVNGDFTHFCVACLLAIRI